MEDTLTHYGVKGMKWGVRKTDRQLGHKPAARKTRTDSGRSGKAGSNTTKKITQAVNRGRDFVSRNKKTIAVVGLSTALSAAGMAWVGSAVMTSYNISTMNLHNYLIDTNQIGRMGM